MKNKVIICPSCAKKYDTLSRSGLAGYCVIHGWCPLDSEDRASIAEAARLNAEEKRKKKWAQIGQVLLNRLTALVKSIAALKKWILVFTALGAFAGGMVKFVVLPGREYDAAKDLLLQGLYQGAKAAFEELGGYKDSEGNVLLCDAIISLQENDLETALAALKELEEDEDEKNAEALRLSLQSVISEWKANGISARTLLSLLKEEELIDPDGVLDLETLSLQAHAELACTKETKAWYAAVLGEEQEKTLLLLDENDTVRAYRMLETENQERILDERAEADCLLIFQEQLADTDPEMAQECGSAALAKAETAFLEAGTTEVFRFYYQTLEKYCGIQKDSGLAAEIWEEFVQKNSAFLISCDMDEAAETKAGELMLAYARDLMAREDVSCSAWLRKAWECGADVEETLLAAVDCFVPGRTRTELRLMEMEFYGEASEEAARQKELLEQELQTLLEEWQDAATPPEDVLYFLTVAEAQGFALDIDVQQTCQKAMLGVTAGDQWKEYRFTDFDSDGKEELLGLSGEDDLEYYVMQEDQLVCVSSLHTEIAPSDLWIDGAGAIGVETEGQDAFAVYICKGQALECVWEVSGALNYQHEEGILTYELILPGSMERRRQYRYDLQQPEKAPEAAGVFWQQDAYPVPDTAEAAAVRYIEALTYQLPEELAVLTAEEADQADGFSMELADRFPMPGDLAKIQAAAYDVADQRALLEVTYPDADTEVRFYAEALYSDGWKIAGFADTFVPGENIDGGDSSIALLPLNGEVKASLQDRNAKDVYRMLLAASSRIQMVWQAGEKQGSKEAFRVCLYSGDTSGEPVMAYDLKLSASKQMSMSLFVPAGLYYVTVEPAMYSDTPYRLSMQAVSDSYAETENNDTADSANIIEQNQAYSASLSDKNDVDYFRFTLEQPGEVHVRLEGSGEGSKQSCYYVQLIREADGKLLTTGEMTGNSSEMDTGAVYVSAGDYVIRIEKGTAWLGMEYQVTAEYTQLEGIEQESNDTPETATVIPVNETVKGSIGTDGDVDCFRFTLEQDAVIQPELTIDPLESSGKAHVVSLLKGTEALLTVNIGGKESSKQLQPLALQAGTYTLRLENVRFARQQYNVSILCEEIPLAEGEPNDTQVQAAEIIIGERLTGVLSSAEDVDWYRLSLPEEQVLILTMEYPQGSGTDDIYHLSLEQNGKSLWSKKLEEGSGGTAEKLQIPAGEYYFCVKAETWKGSVYTLSFE